jgi:hypothetical protein
MQDELDDEGFDWRDPPEEETDRREAFDEFVQGWFRDRGIEWIFVSEVPLSDVGSLGRRSSYGNECYRVSIDPSALLCYLADDEIATGHQHARASAVLYRADVARPQLEWVDMLARQAPPFLDFPHDAPWGGSDGR